MRHGKPGGSISEGEEQLCRRCSRPPQRDYATAKRLKCICRHQPQVRAGSGLDLPNFRMPRNPGVERNDQIGHFDGIPTIRPERGPRFPERLFMANFRLGLFFVLAENQ
jgi:hypothetical protein